MRSDEQLLAATRRDPRAFGEFYARLHFRDAARGAASETLPTGIDGFVLDARAQDPKTLPDP